MVITGVMAAGKSTVAQRLAERLPRSAHVRGDTFRRMIVSGREELMPDATPAAEEQLGLRYRLSAATADAYAAAGFTAIVQDVILGPALADYVTLIRTRPCRVFVLAPQAGAVARREQARGKTGYGAWSVAGLDRALRAETPRIGHWIDNSDQTPDETVDAILARLPES